MEYTAVTLALSYILLLRFHLYAWGLFLCNFSNVSIHMTHRSLDLDLLNLPLKNTA